MSQLPWHFSDADLGASMHPLDYPRLQGHFTRVALMGKTFNCSEHAMNVYGGRDCTVRAVNMAEGQVYTLCYQGQNNISGIRMSESNV